jgi:hypothetical protein
MKRIDLFPFYVLGACIAPLKLLWDIDDGEHYEILLAAKSKLKSLKDEDLAFLGAMRKPIEKLGTLIDEAIGLVKGGGTIRIEGGTERLLNQSVKDFEKILEAEAPTEHTYLVEQLRGFSMPILVDSADKNFSPMTIIRVGDEVEKDIQQAGRCLAFELPTAAGIHMMRAFEKVFRLFYKASTKKDPGTTDIFKLIKDLRDHHPETDPKILNILDQVRDLHRNPLAHEVFLEMDEAIELFDIAKSAITAMARKL